MTMNDCPEAVEEVWMDISVPWLPWMTVNLTLFI
jgi:hypothetical protein